MKPPAFEAYSPPAAGAGPRQKSASEVLRALRDTTAARQSALDALLPLAVDEPGLAQAAQQLQRMQAWLLPLEAWLAGFADGPQDPTVLAPRQRAPLLAADLADPLLQPFLVSTSALGAERPVQPWPDQAGAAYRWGVVYVLEGTQLAGALLHRRVAETLAPLPLRYLAGSAEAEAGGVAGRWQAVVRALNHAVRQRADVAASCQGADDALDRLLALFSAPAPPGPAGPLRPPDAAGTPQLPNTP